MSVLSTETAASLPSSRDSEYLPQLTAGGGDCAFHAVLGEWNGREFKCRDVTARRQEVAGIIINRKSDEPIFGAIKEAIQQLVIGSDRGGSEITKLRAVYERYYNAHQAGFEAAWSKFATELEKHPEVSNYIKKCIQEIPEEQRNKLGTLRLQFQQCLDMHDGKLYGRILSIESLDMAFKEYNRATIATFDLDGYFRSYPQVIEEYVNSIIERQGQWLLPCELAIIAYALNITIVFYTKDLNTHNLKHIETYNSGQPNPKLVCFNGVNHYERMEQPNRMDTLFPQFSRTVSTPSVSSGAAIMPRLATLTSTQVKLSKDDSVAKIQQGFAYQEYLSMLLAYWGMKSYQKSQKLFSLIIEAKVPEAWNDIVFEWGQQLVFFQQKHRSDYSATIQEKYSKADLFAAKTDVSILKYYHAYRELIDKHEGLLQNKTSKFIFFTNRGLPISEVKVNGAEQFYIKFKKPVKKDGETVSLAIIRLYFKKIIGQEIPLIDMDGFHDIVNGDEIWQISDIELINIDNWEGWKQFLQENSLEKLKQFFVSFYFFTKQKNAEELLQYGNRVIKAQDGGFSQAVLVDVFSHYIHQWFIAENPEHHRLDANAIKDFFDNQERYYANLVKYSCFDPRGDEYKSLCKLLEVHMDKIKQIPCIQRILISLNEKEGKELIVQCANPMLSLFIIQELFSAGERQVFTPFSAGLADYQVTKQLKYAIVVGADSEINSVVAKLKKAKLNIIRIKMPLPESTGHTISLQVNCQEISFLASEFSAIAVLPDKVIMCLTDFLLLAISKLSNGLSETELTRYVEQRREVEKVVLPCKALETAIISWADRNKKQLDRSWFVEGKGDSRKLQCKIRIKLPEFLSFFDIQQFDIQQIERKNQKFSLISRDGSPAALDYIYEESTYFYIQYSEKVQQLDGIEKLQQQLDAWIRDNKPFSCKECSYEHDVAKIVLISLSTPYTGEDIPNKNWGISKNKKCLFYYPYGKAKLYKLNWQEVYPPQKVNIIKAEAACGKTWCLRARISEENIKLYRTIPIFLRIKDIENIEQIEVSPNLIDKLFATQSLPGYLQRVAQQLPASFHLFLDGFDELQDEFLEKFKKIVSKLIELKFSLTITVRDYQVDKLQDNISVVSIHETLRIFNKSEIEKCFERALPDTKEAERKKLCEWLNQDREVKKWLGIPLHIALIAEWYRGNGKSVLEDTTKLSITAIYNFILQNRITKNITIGNPGDIYKILYRIAWLQIFGTEQLPLTIKQHRFKEGLKLILARTGLLLNPYAENPELFHRTFAEFLVAKKLLRGMLSLSCSDNESNLKLIQCLHNVNFKLINRFFLELFKSTIDTMDIPYEPSQQQQANFERFWLCDISAQDLLTVQTEPVQTEQVVIKLVGSLQEESRQDESTEQMDCAEELLQLDIPSLEDESYGYFWLSKVYLLKIEDITNLSDLTKDIGENDVVLIKIEGSMDEPQYRIGYKHKKEFMLIELPILDSIDQAFPIEFYSQEEIKLNQEQYKYIIKFLIEQKIDIGLDICKISAKEHILGCFGRYTKCPENKRAEFYEMIRRVNIRFFMELSCLDLNLSVEEIDEFNIKNLEKIIIALTLNATYGSAFRRCWSRDFCDKDFAYPVLEKIGQHLNIVHVLYIIYYDKYGIGRGYEIDTMSIAKNHINTLPINDSTDLRVIFSSVLLFLIKFDDFKEKQEYFRLSANIVKQLMKAFTRLFRKENMTDENRMFINILFVYFMHLFNIRGHFVNPNIPAEGLALIFQDGSVINMKVDGNFCEQQPFFHKIRIELISSKTTPTTQKYLAIDRLQSLIKLWDIMLMQRLTESPVGSTETTAVAMEDELPVSPRGTPNTKRPVSQLFSSSEQQVASADEGPSPSKKSKVGGQQISQQQVSSMLTRYNSGQPTLLQIEPESRQETLPSTPTTPTCSMRPV